jgi:hypothetical protein
LFVDQYVDRDCRSAGFQPSMLLWLTHSLPVNRNLLRLNGRKLNERLDGEQQQRAEAVERQDARLAEIRELSRESNRLVAIGNRTSERIFEALRLDWLRGLGSELKSLMPRTNAMNVTIYKAAISIQGLLPSHLKRSLIEEPFILEDAIGRLSPVHLKFICSWEAFEDVLVHRFRDLTDIGR